MKSIVILLVFSTLLLLGAAPPQSGPTLALVSKVIFDVARKEVDKEWKPAKRGETLSSGERVRTGEKSVAVIKFKDNSMLRVRELTEVLVTGEQSGKLLSKSALIERGVIGFNIKKQRDGEEFRFSSPTSVASIRGTSGQFGAEDSTDKLVVVEGLVRLTNRVSSQFIDVEAGFTGLSSPDGKLLLRPSTSEERLAADLASRLGDKENRLEIELNDGQGNKKRIDIKFK